MYPIIFTPLIYYNHLRWSRHSCCISFLNEKIVKLWICFIWAATRQNQKVSVRPAKTQISLGIRPVWSESSLSAWRNLGPLATHWVHSKDSDLTGRMPRLIWVFAGRTVTLLVLSCRGSFYFTSLHLSLVMRKCVFWSLWPGKIQTSLLSYRSKLESWNFGFSKYTYY